MWNCSGFHMPTINVSACIWLCCSQSASVKKTNACTISAADAAAVHNNFSGSTFFQSIFVTLHISHNTFPMDRIFVSRAHTFSNLTLVRPLFAKPIWYIRFSFGCIELDFSKWNLWDFFSLFLLYHPVSIRAFEIACTKSQEKFKRERCVCTVSVGYLFIYFIFFFSFVVLLCAVRCIVLRCVLFFSVNLSCALQLSFYGRLSPFREKGNVCRKHS